MKTSHVCPACDKAKIHYRKFVDNYKCGDCKAVFFFSVPKGKLVTIDERFTEGG